MRDPGARLGDDHDPCGRVTRREVLRAGSLYGGAVWISLHLPGTAEAASDPGAATPAVPTPSSPTPSATPSVLSPAEWRTIEAATGRILPEGEGEGEDDGPGAISAGCVQFIDRTLAGPDAAALPLYRVGAPGLDAVSQRRFERDFAALGPEQQDEVLLAVERGDAPGWPEGPVPSPLFFETLRAHTILGFLADPRHGGNRDHAGWKLVGHPGPRHAGGGYTPAQMRGEAPIRAVWGQDLPGGSAAPQAQIGGRRSDQGSACSSCAATRISRSSRP